MLNVGRIVLLAVAGVLMLIGLLSLGSMMEFLDAGHIMVIQYPRGELRVAVDPGIYPQWWGTVTKYPKRDQFFFTCAKEAKDDHSLPITFNDGGTAKMCGQIAWGMPLDVKHVIALHTQYRSHEAIEQQLIRPVIAKSITFTGPLMSSTESYAARKSDLLSFLEDQIVGGIYKTESQQVRAKDPMTGIDKTVTQVTMIRDQKTGLISRQDNSPLDDFGIKTFNLAIDDIRYDPAVSGQIKQQQEAYAKVATAVANAKEAEQRAITAAKNGEAEAAKAKWEQEVIKAREVTKAEQERQVAVTQAQQRKEVATLAADAAAMTKRESILLGEGEAERRKLVMNADGALDRKLETYEKVQNRWAQAFENFKGQLVPQVVTGGTGGMAPGGASNAALDFMQIMGIKAARDLAVNPVPQAQPAQTPQR